MAQYTRLDGSPVTKPSTEGLGNVELEPLRPTGSPQDRSWDPTPPSSTHLQPPRDSAEWALVDLSLRGDDFLIDMSELQLIEELPTGLSMRMSFMNMANSILGAGVIGQPYAVRQCGLLTAFLLIPLLTFLIDWTLRLIVINAKLSGTSSYNATVTHCFGRGGHLVIQLSQALFAFGGSAAFCVIIGDTIPHVLQAFLRPSTSFTHWLLSRNVIIVVFTMGISFPLSLNRDISKLAKALAAALGGMLVIVVIVLVRGPLLSAEYKGVLETSSYFVSPGVFQGISVISFALVCHHNTIFIYNALQKPTLNRFTTLTHISCLVSMVVVAVMGFGGFGVFRNLTKANVLNNFPKDDVVANIARLCFGLNMLTTFPLEIFVAREVIKDLLVPESVELSRNAHALVTTALVVSTMGVALTTCNLGAILELVGSTSACLMAYILPPLCWVKMAGTGKGWRGLTGPVACVIFGVVVMIVSSAQTIRQAMHGESGECAA